jgi:hypothetical protein
MPDLKSELSKVLQSWEEPTTMTPPTSKRITSNSTRRTFDYILHNPGRTRAQVITALEADGVLPQSSTSLVSTFIINGNVRETDGLLYAAQTEYAPLKRPKPAPERAMAKDATPEAPVQSVAPAEPEPFSVAAILDTLTVRQARAVYDELKHIFGG